MANMEQLIAKQNELSDMWDETLPPPDGQIVINHLGTVCMSYNTLKKLGYECNSTDKILEEWKKEWQNES